LEFIMHRLAFAFVLGLILASGAAYSAQQGVRDIYSDTWVGSDGLGRTMPGSADVGPVKKDQRRVVGIFYITWHSDSAGASATLAFSAKMTRSTSSPPSDRA
jgi:hypothetical protein